MTKIGDTYYRYEGYADNETNHHIALIKFKVIKITPCGVWIGQYGDKPKFILNSARKKAAHSNIEDAFISLKARRKAQADILQMMLDKVRLTISYIENKTPKDLNDETHP